MEWIEEIQPTLGQPVVDFALSHWAVIAAIAVVATFWLIFGTFGHHEDEGLIVFGRRRRPEEDSGLELGGDSED